MLKIDSSYTQRQTGDKLDYTVYGKRFSVHQKTRRLVVSVLLPCLILALPVLVLAGFLNTYLPQQGTLLAVLAGLLVLVFVALRLARDQRRIRVAPGQGLIINGHLVRRDDIRSLSITRLKSHLYDDGSSYLSAALPDGEHRLSPYIDKDVAKALLKELSATLNEGGATAA